MLQFRLYLVEKKILIWLKSDYVEKRLSMYTKFEAKTVFQKSRPNQTRYVPMK